MQEGDVFSVDNQNLREALDLRREKKIPQALVKLNAACAEGDGKSLYLKALAYKYGGWGLCRNDRLGIKYMKMSKKRDCFWALYWDDYYHTYNNDDVYPLAFSARPVESTIQAFAEALRNGCPFVYYTMKDWVEDMKEREWMLLSAKQGDVFGLYHAYGMSELSSEENFRLLSEGAAQCNWDCVKALSDWYLIDNKKYESVKIILYNVKEVFGTAKIVIERLCDWNKNNLPEMYLLGRFLSTRLHLSFGKNAVKVFVKTKTAVQQAIFVFMLICRRMGLLSKDMRRVVGELIWESRYDPEIWLGTEQISLLKKQKY